MVRISVLSSHSGLQCHALCGGGEIERLQSERLQRRLGLILTGKRSACADASTSPRSVVGGGGGAGGA